MEYLHFFFDDFWHWFAGLVYLCVICHFSLIRIDKKDNSDNKNN